MIPYLHEQWEHIRITVASILASTPEQLLEEDVQFYKIAGYGLAHIIVSYCLCYFSHTYYTVVSI